MIWSLDPHCKIRAYGTCKTLLPTKIISPFLHIPINPTGKPTKNSNFNGGKI